MKMTWRFKPLFTLYILVTCCHNSAGDWAKYEDFIRSHSNNETFLKLFHEHAKGFESLEEAIYYEPFPCDTYQPPQRTVNVHSLSPADINVVAAFGDSITAGTGIVASTPLGLLVQYRGLSWSIGGDGSVEHHVTIPNMIKEYNPNVKGFSIGNGKVDSENAHFNVAEPGDTAFDMIEKAKELISRMKMDTEIDFQNDWKLITVFIGSNDLCFYCSKKKEYSVEEYTKNVQHTLDILHENIPKAFINLVQVSNIAELHVLNGGAFCDIIHLFLCQCGAYPTKQNKIIERQGVQSYQRALRELVESGRYDTRDDFTVVVQPFYENTPIPKLPNGSADFSYFAPDCFHPSKKGHRAAAKALWNNMIEPVGQKTTRWTPNKPVKCPSARRPYFFTHLNGGFDGSNEHLGADDSVPNDVERQAMDPADAGDSVGLVAVLALGLVFVVIVVAIVLLSSFFLFKVQKKKDESAPLHMKSVHAMYTDF